MTCPPRPQDSAMHNLDRWCATLAGQAPPDGETESAALLRDALLNDPSCDEPTVDEAAVDRMMQKLAQDGAFSNACRAPTARPSPKADRVPVAQALSEPGTSSFNTRGASRDRTRLAWGPRHRRSAALGAAVLAVLALPMGLNLWRDSGHNHSTIANAGNSPLSTASPASTGEPLGSVGFTRLPIVPTAWVADPEASARRLAAVLERQGIAVRLDRTGADHIVQAQLPDPWPKERLAEVQRALGTDMVTANPGAPLVVRFAQTKR